MKANANHDEARELELFAVNDADTYFAIIVPTIRNMEKKASRGIYDPDKATKAFEHVAEYAARVYNTRFGSSGRRSFNPATRRAVAAALAERYRPELAE